MYKSKKGITLIALVVTIIVLLILAGISISMLTGNNSILQKATTAKENTDNAQIKERIQLAELAARTDGNGELTYSNLNTQLSKEFGEKGTGYNISDEAENPWKVKVGNVEYDISHTEIMPPATGNLNADEIAGLPNGVVEISKDDVVNTNIKNNDNIRAVITGEIPIPNGFYYVGGTIDEGVVISDKEADSGKGTSHAIAQTLQGNQFVWVPVPIVVWDEATTITSGTYTPLAKLQTNSSINYEGLLYSFNGTTSTYRVSATTTGIEPYEIEYDDFEGTEVFDNDHGITLSLLQTEYNDMVVSVNKYKGFFVARYELGLEGTKPVSKPANSNIITADASNSETNTWYGLYAKAKSMYSNSSSANVTSTMIWGSQYDAMMNWMAKTGNAVGTVDQNKYNQATTTGSKSEDILNNVYDLYGCHYEWTLEMSNGLGRTHRGGSFNASAVHSPSYIDGVNPNYAYGDPNDASSRLSIYIK